MSAPVLWMILPGLGAGVLFIFRRWTRIVTLAGAGLALILAFFAWKLPVETPTSLGPWTLVISDTLTALGRAFVLDQQSLPIVAVIYLITAFWLAGAILARPGELFTPIALGMVASLTAALAVQPFLYAALLIEVAVLLSIPLLVPPGSRPGRGVFRFLTFQTLGMPFILFTGWMLVGVEASPSDLDLVVRASVLMGLGFAFLMAIFPFHSWIPMLASESHPYAAAFVMFLLPFIISQFALGFIDRYAWLRLSPAVYDLLRWTGALMAAMGGLGAAFQRNLGRMLGYAVVVEIGFSLLAVSLATPAGMEIFYTLLLPRSLGLGIWALALAVLKSSSGGEQSFHGLQGIGRRFPLTATALVMAIYALAGLPLLAGFPVRLALWEQLAAQDAFIALGALAGGVGLLVGGTRALAVFVMGGDEEAVPVGEGLVVQFFFGIGMLALLLGGLFPQWFLPFLARLPEAFEHLSR